MLTELTRYLRHAMPKLRSPMSTLDQEFELADALLQIARMRMGGRLTVVTALPERLRETAFPPLLLQTLVENALKHGVEPKPGPVCIALSASMSPQGLVVEVVDDGVGLGKAPTAGGGAGLANIRERLQAMHGGQAHITVADNEGTGVTARVLLPAPTSAGES